MSAKIDKVLIIDDDEINNFVCEKVIKTSGLVNEVKSLKSGQEGLNYLKEQAHQSQEAVPDVILLDINMPFMDGWEFMDHMRSLFPDTLPSIPIVAILSSSVYEADAEKAFQYPDIKEYITKPLTLEAFQNFLHQHLLP